MKVRTKLILPLGAVALLLVFFLYSYWIPSYTQDVEQRLPNEERVHLRTLGTALVSPLLKGELSEVYELLDAQRALRPDWESVKLLDGDGKRLYPLDEFDGEAALIRNLELREIVAHGDADLAVLIVHVNLEQRVADMVSRAEELGFAMVVATVLSMLAVAVLQDRIVGHRLKSIAGAAMRLRGGDFAATLPDAGSDEVGELAGGFAEMRDSIRDYQHKLRGEASRLRSVLDNIVDAILTIDETGRIETINPAVSTMFNYEEQELIGKNVRMLMPEPHQSLHDGYLRNFCNGGEPRIIGSPRREYGMRKDGSVFPMELRVSEIHTKEGRMFLGAIRDLSESTKVERMKREFVSTVSHELRTPLTSIRGSLGLLAGGVVGEIPAEARKLLDIACENSDRLSGLIDDLLDMEKIASGKMQFLFEEVPVSALINEVVTNNQPLADQHHVQLEVLACDDSVRVHADRDRLIQVVVNLLSNAVKFSPRDERVRIESIVSADWVEFAVSDKGPGIPDAFRERIFEKFSQADSSDTRQKGGTGLGLNIARALVQAMQGEIGFESEPGNGTRFYFRLPRAGDRRPAG